MQSKLSFGDLAFGGGFALAGLFWIATSATMPMWEGFTPGSGFLPLIYGIVLAALSALQLATAYASRELSSSETEAAVREPIGKPLLVLAALALAVLGMEPAGFDIAVFVMLVFLYGYVEKLPLLRAVAVSACTVASLALIFRFWLGVPLPTGYFGL
jgi:putative tricarboxylic transport membrane protein